MHFTRHSTYEEGGHVPIIVRGEGAYIWDDAGKRYLDGLAGLFVVQVGHGRTELAEAAAKQMQELAFFPLWSYAHPTAIELAERLSHYAPGDLNRVFFTTGGGEAVESCLEAGQAVLQAHRQADEAQGDQPRGRLPRHPAGSAVDHRHPGRQEVLRAAGARRVHKVPNTNFYRAPEHGDDIEAFGRWAADRIAEAIEFEGPDTVAAVFLEPVQNSGGCFPPPPGYLERVREICDEYDVLLVADETICAFGRIGEMFAMSRFGVTPDIITCAKGMTSGYAPIGRDDRERPPLRAVQARHNYFAHGYTFGGHPVLGCGGAGQPRPLRARGAQRARPRQRGRLPQHAREAAATCRSSATCAATGYFYGIELVKDKDTKETFNDDESERLLRGFLSKALFDAGLYCRADDRGDPVIQLAPPLIIGQAEFDEIEQILRSVLTEGMNVL